MLSISMLYGAYCITSKFEFTNTVTHDLHRAKKATSEAGVGWCDDVHLPRLLIEDHHYDCRRPLSL